MKGTKGTILGIVDNWKEGGDRLLWIKGGSIYWWNRMEGRGVII